jgi:hypothetical protein
LNNTEPSLQWGGETNARKQVEKQMWIEQTFRTSVNTSDNKRNRP